MGKIGNIKKQTEVLQKQRSRFAKVEEELQSKCLHTKNGELALIPSHSGEPNTYVCHLCRKVVKLSRVEPEELENAIGTIDRACDIIKLNVVADRDEDIDVAEKIAKLQYRVRNLLKPCYFASLKNGNRGKKKNRDYSNDNSGWGKPTSGN